MNRIGRHLQDRLTYANVMATVAVFLALGGGAVAAKKLKSNSVGSSQIKADAVQGIDANESSFGQVPSAASADRATTAGSAANATNAANADQLDNLDSDDIGLGFFSGRVNTLGTGIPGGTTGSPPSGLSTANSDADLADQDLTLSPNRTIVMRNLSVTLTQPVTCPGSCGGGENVTVALEAFVGSTETTSISCIILAAPSQSSCPAVGPSSTVPASSGLRLSIVRSGDATIASGTDALFSWRATAP